MRSRFLQRGYVVAALLCFSLPVRAQNNQPPISVPQVDLGILGQPGFRFAEGVPDGVSLIPNGAGARTGRVWIGNTGESIRIVGEVDGGPPDWPKGKDSILSKDHVEVWLAGNADVDLPPPVWSARFSGGARSADQCKDVASGSSPGEDHAQDCRDWFETQEKDYRPLFQKLFVRQWLLANGVSEESYATPAYAAVSEKYKPDGLAALKPHGDVQFRWQARAASRAICSRLISLIRRFPAQHAANSRNAFNGGCFRPGTRGQKRRRFFHDLKRQSLRKSGIVQHLEVQPSVTIRDNSLRFETGG